MQATEHNFLSTLWKPTCEAHSLSSEHFASSACLSLMFNEEIKVFPQCWSNPSSRHYLSATPCLLTISSGPRKVALAMLSFGEMCSPCDCYL